MIRNRFLVVLMVLAAFALTILAPIAAHASTKGRRNTMYAAAAVTLYFVSKKKTLPAVAAAAGTYYAYKKYQDSKDR